MSVIFLFLFIVVTFVIILCDYISKVMKRVLLLLVLLIVSAACVPVFSQEKTQKDKSYWLRRYLSVSYPVRHTVVGSGYGLRSDPFTKKRVMHSGVDIKAKYEEVYSMFSGIVEQVSSDSRAGRYIRCRYGDITVSYCHLSEYLVSVGDSVCAGDPIAVSGNSGRSTAPHLHLTVRRHGQLVNPTILLDYVDAVRGQCISVLGASQAVSTEQPMGRREFLEYYADMAMEHQRRYGIPSSVTLSQMAHESEFGTSALAVKGKNFFGIKCSRDWLASGKPYSLHHDERPNEKFCNYRSAKESMEHHSRLLTNSRYKKYCSFPPTDYHSWLVGLIRAGYASPKGYVAACERIIKQYNLHRYDLLANRL